VRRGVGVGSSGRAFWGKTFSVGRAIHRRDAGRDDPPLSRYLRDSGVQPLTPSVRTFACARFGFPEIPARCGPFCLSVSGGRLRLRRRVGGPLLSRGGCLGRGGECARSNDDAKGIDGLFGQKGSLRFARRAGLPPPPLRLSWNWRVIFRAHWCGSAGDRLQDVRRVQMEDTGLAGALVVLNLRSAISGELYFRDTSSLFSVACLSPTSAAECDELRGQDTSSLFTTAKRGRYATHTSLRSDARSARTFVITLAPGRLVRSGLDAGMGCGDVAGRLPDRRL
jgi:hypothetical protein